MPKTSKSTPKSSKKPAAAGKTAAATAAGKTAATAAGTAPAAPSNVLAFISPDLITDGGQGHLVIVRDVGKGNGEFAVIDLDTQCLGARKIKIAILPLPFIASRVLPALGVTAVATPIALAVLNGSVAFAKSLGFQTHGLLAETLTMLAGVEPAEPPYAFGKDGKPFYVQQTYDSDDFAENICSHLKRLLGTGGYEFLAREDNPDLVDDGGSGAVLDDGDDSGDDASDGGFWGDAGDDDAGDDFDSIVRD
jgi:hypothetical protein